MNVYYFNSRETRLTVIKGQRKREQTLLQVNGFLLRDRNLFINYVCMTCVD